MKGIQGYIWQNPMDTSHRYSFSVTMELGLCEEKVANTTAYGDIK